MPQAREGRASGRDRADRTGHRAERRARERAARRCRRRCRTGCAPGASVIGSRFWGFFLDMRLSGEELRSAALACAQDEIPPATAGGTNAAGDGRRRVAQARELRAPQKTQDEALTTSWFSTDLTPPVSLAIATARSRLAGLSAVPLSVTTPSLVSTSIFRPLTSGIGEQRGLHLGGDGAVLDGGAGLVGGALGVVLHLVGRRLRGRRRFRRRIGHRRGGRGRAVGTRVVVFWSQPASRPTEAIVAMDTEISERRRVGFMGVPCRSWTYPAYRQGQCPTRDSDRRSRCCPTSGAACARADGRATRSARRRGRHDLAQQLDQQRPLGARQRRQRRLFHGRRDLARALGERPAGRR